MLPVLTITLNPALDLTTSVAGMVPLRKLRCAAPRFDPGGGGINVSRAIRELGGESHAFVAVGGHTGAQLRDLLNRSGLQLEYWPLVGETRISVTIMDEEKAVPYRFLLPGPTVSAFEADAILEQIAAHIRRYTGYVVASGSLPPGIPDDFYARLARRTRELGGRFVIDTHGLPLRLAAEERPYLIRLNHLEAQELVGGEADAAAHELAGQLVQRQLAEIAIVTIGERGAILSTPGRQLEIRPPKVAVKSGVGAGDSYVAALVFALASGWPLEEAARYGVAAAAAAVTTEATELCKREVVDAFYAQIGGLQARPAA
ncbi:MAG TPA: 1-phosphofructokinase family hexose kinase [Devosia sp.]|nr:1-phosphofructokinase family hexose kinase [Devosia sp.]